MKCPMCSCPGAYVGVWKIECINKECLYHAPIDVDKVDRTDPNNPTYGGDSAAVIAKWRRDHAD